MCLNRLTVKRTLKKDKTVFKHMKYKKGIETTPYYPRDFNIKFLKANTKIEIDIWNGVRKIWDEKYNSGWHCFVKKSDAIFFQGGSLGLILKYIIPKGTDVQYGYQNIYNNLNDEEKDLSVIVTPTLINPRIK